MISNTSSIRVLLTLIILILLAGCRATGNHRAPVEDRNGNSRNESSDSRNSTAKNWSGSNSSKNDQDSYSQIHIVEKGETLYSIAFENGLDYREVAEQNNIENPAAIQIGQQIKLITSEDNSYGKTRVETRSIATVPSNQVAIKDYPKIAKIPYSDDAIVQIEKSQKVSGRSTDVSVTAAARPVVTMPQKSETGSDDNLSWGMPTNGKVIGGYSESDNRKGVDISGMKGQSILASATGKVVYSGSGLRGYGKLVIIKHNKTFLSAYAHNDQIMVKEGENVNKGQKIAEMGSTDADQVKLHFEIRQFGKPVDPAKFLNLNKP